MRNVRVVSFKEGVIEAGTARLRTRREEIIQEDQLYPYAMTDHGMYLAIANMDKNLEKIGAMADPMVLKDLGWSVPESVFEGKGLPPEVMVPKNIYPVAPQAPAVVETPVKVSEETKKAVTDMVLGTEARILDEKGKDEPRSKKKHSR
jgi:hypothetical protein